MEGQQYVQLPPGTTECNHSYYAGNSFSASHSVQQLQNCTITNSVQSPSYTQEANGVASSGFVSSPPLPCSTISLQVPVCPTRHVTGDVMPLAEAITQLSFLEFLQRCGVSIAPPQPSQLSVPISLLDAAVQATPQSTLSQHVSTQMGSRSASSFSVDVFVQTPITQCGATRCCHTTTDHGVLYWLYFLERSSGPPKLCSSVLVISTRSTCLAAATARSRTARPAFGSRYWSSLAHYTWRIYCSCTSTSPATFSYFSFASTAPCLYHPCGNTSCVISHYR